MEIMCHYIQLFAVREYADPKTDFFNGSRGVVNSDLSATSSEHDHRLMLFELRLLATITRAPFTGAPRTGKTIASNHIGVNPSLWVILSFSKRLLYLSFRTAG
jgi:hypothetical protein